MEPVDTATALAAASSIEHFQDDATSPRQKEVVDTITGKVVIYYSKKHVFDFYTEVYGGDSIHVGLYSMLEGDDAKLEGVAKISKATSLSTKELLSRFFPSDSGFLPDKCTVMDMGSGFGGIGRPAAKELGCKVICIEICKRENDYNAALTRTAGLEDKVIIPGERSFFDTGMPDSSCEVVCSQDALIHAGSERYKAIVEAARVLKPGGRMVFMDVMVRDEATAQDFAEVHVPDLTDSLGSVKLYKEWGKVYGLDFVEFVDHTIDLATHYEMVGQVALTRRGKEDGKHDEFIDKMVARTAAWTSGARNNVLCWGMIVLKKPESV